MKLDDFLSEKKGRASWLSNTIGIDKGYMSLLRKGILKVPIHHCLSIEIVTNGAVTREDLRPEDAHLIWPDIASKRGLINWECSCCKMNDK